MSMLLASVNSLAEAQLAQRCEVDIIDLKQPALGALGALATETVGEIVSALGVTQPISATIGDLAMQRPLVCEAVVAMAATGVAYIKIGFFPGGDPLDCIAGLSQLTRLGHALIAVLFADKAPDFELIPQLAAAGFRGVMLDTMQKQHGSLPELLSCSELHNFVQTAKSYGLLTGLAGSLKCADIGALLALEADYLGFRGALCRQGCRTAELDVDQLNEIRAQLTGRTPVT